MTVNRNAMCFCLLEFADPGSVRSLQTTYVSATQISLSWVAPADTTGCPPQSNLQYVVTFTGESLQDECYLDPHGGTLSATLNLYLTISSAKPYHRYTIGVFAEDWESNKVEITVDTPEAGRAPLLTRCIYLIIIRPSLYML